MSGQSVREAASAMTLAVDLIFCDAADARAVARVAAWGEEAGGDPAAGAMLVQHTSPHILACQRPRKRCCMH